ncbi:MAG: DsrH/TusB family sulfur metabolism protein [Candidatus Thorarchaeota archaeon]
MMTNEIVYLFGHKSRGSNNLKKLTKIISIHLSDGHSVALALVHDAVVGVAPKDYEIEEVKTLLSMGTSVYALRPDLEARGLHKMEIAEDITLIGYSELLELIIQSKTLCSWM